MLQKSLGTACSIEAFSLFAIHDKTRQVYVDINVKQSYKILRN